MCICEIFKYMFVFIGLCLFKKLMDWHTCFLSLLYKNVVLAVAPGLPKI